MSEIRCQPPCQAVVIGASAGALEVLNQVLPALPASFPLPVFVVVHVPPDRKSLLAELFARRCAMRVREAEDKEPIDPGTVYFAPPNYHMLVETPQALALSADEPVLYSRPAIDILFESAADVYGPALAALVLTGANEDGVRGLRAAAAAGGQVAVQDPQTAFAAAMPEAALAACPQARIVTPGGIAAYLQELAARPPVDKN